MEKLFVGTTEDCLKHYREKIGKKKEAVSSAYDEIGKLVSVNRDTISAWFCGKNKPISINLLIIRHFLSDKGYGVKELRDLPLEVFNLSWLIAHKKLSMEEAEKSLGLTKEQIMRYVLAYQGISDERKEKIKKLIEPFANQIPSAKISQGELLAKAPDKSVGTTTDKSKESVITLLAQLIKSALPLADYVESDECSPEDRRLLRKQSGGDGIFRLLNVLYNLCGESVRKEAREGNRSLTKQPKGG